MNDSMITPAILEAYRQTYLEAREGQPGRHIQAHTAGLEAAFKAGNVPVETLRCAVREATRLQQLFSDLTGGHQAAVANLAQEREQNDILRKLLATSNADCPYCKLPARDMARCQSGFPGCARADDMGDSVVLALDPIPMDTAIPEGLHSTPIPDSVIPDWTLGLSFQQQSVLLLALRGPDGVRKIHPAKAITIAYRATMLRAAMRQRFLEWGEGADGFMSLAVIANDIEWTAAVKVFFHHVDELPHHYVAHMAHAAQIIAAHHPDERMRHAWGRFYREWCRDLHVEAESVEEMDERLDDWGTAPARLASRTLPPEAAAPSGSVGDEAIAHLIWNAVFWSSGNAWDLTPERDAGKQKARAIARDIAALAQQPAPQAPVADAAGVSLGLESTVRDALVEAIERGLRGPSAEQDGMYGGFITLSVSLVKPLLAAITPPQAARPGDGVGPTTITNVRRTCEGCSALRTKDWKFYGENDDIDSGTDAKCASAENRHISSYWDGLKDTPDWCPALAPVQADAAEGRS